MALAVRRSVRLVLRLAACGVVVWAVGDCSAAEAQGGLQLASGRIARIENTTSRSVSYRLSAGDEDGGPVQLAPGAVQHVRLQHRSDDTCGGLRASLMYVAAGKRRSMALRAGRTYRWASDSTGPGALRCEVVELRPAHEPLRTVRVLLAAGEAYRRLHTDWRGRIRDVLAQAAEHYAVEFGIRLVPVGFAAWRYDQAPATAGQALKSLYRAVPPDGADLVLAFTLFSFPGATRGSEIRGLSQYFARHVIVPDEWAVRGAALRVLHELGHVFGAYHDRESGSIMAPAFRGAPRWLVFSHSMRRQIALTRTFDFRRGVEGLDPKVRDKLQQWFAADRHPSEPLERDPVSAALEHRANCAEWDGRTAEAARLRKLAERARQRLSAAANADSAGP